MFPHVVLPSHDSLTFATAKSVERRNWLVQSGVVGDEPLVRVLASVATRLVASFMFTVFVCHPSVHSFAKVEDVGPGEIKNIYFHERNTRGEGRRSHKPVTHLAAKGRSRMSGKLVKQAGATEGVSGNLLLTFEMYTGSCQRRAKGSKGDGEGWEKGQVGNTRQLRRWELIWDIALTWRIGSGYRGFWTCSWDHLYPVQRTSQSIRDTKEKFMNSQKSLLANAALNSYDCLIVVTIDIRSVNSCLMLLVHKKDTYFVL